MKHLLTASIIAAAFTSPVRAEVIKLHCVNIDNTRVRTEFTLDMQEQQIIDHPYYDGGTTTIIHWDERLIAWVQNLVPDDSDEDDMIASLYLSRPYLLLTEYAYFTDDELPDAPIMDTYQCTRGLTEQDIALPPLPSNDELTTVVELPQEEITSLMSAWGSSILLSLENNPNRPSGVGFATIRLVIDTDGNLSTTRILSSTGNTDLDEQLLSWIENSAPFEQAPEGIAAARYNFDLPIRLR